MLVVGSVCYCAGKCGRFSGDGASYSGGGRSCSDDCPYFRFRFWLKAKSYCNNEAYRFGADCKPILHPGIIKALTFSPAAPSKLIVSTTCTYSVFHILTVRTDKLSWPAASTATGYYVYENGSKVSGTSGTSINLIATTSTGNVSFGIAAYNSWGASGTTSASSHC